jgi:hypothetical protein
MQQSIKSILAVLIGLAVVASATAASATPTKPHAGWAQKAFMPRT